MRVGRDDILENPGWVEVNPEAMDWWETYVTGLPL